MSATRSAHTSPRSRRRHIVALLTMALVAQLCASVLASPASASALPERIKINFQPAGAEVPSTYVADSGEAYSSERGYGWHAADGTTRQCTDRNADAVQRIDTFCHATMRYDTDGVYWTPIWSAATWSADLANGTYDVSITVGDTGYNHPDIVASTQANGVSFHNQVRTTAESRTNTITQRITITDTKLHLTFWGGNDTKLNSVKAIPVADYPTPTTTAQTTTAPTTTAPVTTAPVTTAPVTTAPVTTAPVTTVPVVTGKAIKINFAPANAPVPAGFSTDSGLDYTPAQGYGWILPDGEPRQCADRKITGDPEIDTFCHATTRYVDGAEVTAIASPATWQADVANGTYNVAVTVGDNSTRRSLARHSTQVNGVSVHDRLETTSDKPFNTTTVVVAVTDGRLRLTFDGGTRTKVISLKATPTTAGPTTTTTAAPTTTTTVAPNPAPSAPVIDVWDGLVRNIGAAGVPQRFVNILGNVSDNGTVARLTARVNDGSTRVMRLGPGDRRLARAGDFNVDILVADLRTGANQIVLDATDNDGNTSRTIVTVNFTPANPQPQARVNWSRLNGVDDAGLVVDGKWTFTNGGIRTEEAGYDRIIAIGDLDWESYEVTTTVTLHGFTPDGFDSPSNGPGVGLFAHWSGHTNNPAGTDPLVGFLPDADGNVAFGALAWVRWIENSRTQARILGPDARVKVTTPYTWNVGETQNIRMQVVGGDNPTYRWRIWRDGIAEPTAWQTLSLTGVTSGQGSVGLIAHEADATFGDVVITPLP